MKSRILPIFTVLAAAALAACGDDLFDVRARFEVETDTLTLYAINGSAPTAPVGLNTPFLAAVRADSSFNFDLAFDFAGEDSVRVIPVSRVGGAFGSNRRVGIAPMDVPFESITRAPNGGYLFDSTVTVGVGQAFAVQAVTPYCQLDASSQVFSKIVVDSVDAATRALYLRLVVDPNCGFMGLVDGVVPGS
jgi:hypothetical protein